MLPFAVHPVGVSGMLAVLARLHCAEQTGAAGCRASEHPRSVRRSISAAWTRPCPPYASLLVKYDPFLTDYAALCDRLRALEKLADVRFRGSDGQNRRQSPSVTAASIRRGSAFCRQTRGADARKRSSRCTAPSPTAFICSVFCRGSRIWAGWTSGCTHRGLSTPRTSNPGGQQWGSAANRRASIRWQSPGGWQLIGRTPLTLFDAGANPCPMRRATASGLCPSMKMNLRASAKARRRNAMTLNIVSPGPLTTVQDFGRFGHQAEGYPECGACDKYALALANLLCGNGECPHMAGLEYTLAGPTLRADDYDARRADGRRSRAEGQRKTRKHVRAASARPRRYAGNRHARLRPARLSGRVRRV